MFLSRSEKMADLSLYHYLKYCVNINNIEDFMKVGGPSHPLDCSQSPIFS